MGSWGFVLLAYGIVWSVLLVYLIALKSRIRSVEARLAQIRSSASAEKYAK